MKINSTKPIILALAVLLFSACSGGPYPRNTTVNQTSNDLGKIPRADQGMPRDMGHGPGMPMDGNMGNMSGMPMGSDPGAENAPYDLRFIDSMIHHHQGALRMSEMIVRRSQNAELKQFAQDIISDQTGEISRMREWRDQWFPGAPRALSADIPGMGPSMMMMRDRLGPMSAASSGDVDRMFLEMMIPHHEGAIQMARDAQTRAEHAELKDLAAEIVREQQSEIDKMNAWLKK